MSAEDDAFHAHLKELRPTLTAEFFELKKRWYESDSVQASISELRMFEKFQTPYEKITCIYNSCRILTCKYYL